ncbi:MAG: hypothetical protein KAU62_02380 [Candidatus Heimdallarchaeota archaeon]|nr:hypothetical protein [Candidatus Heimdallarchaeota archaeon]MCG3254907.1 hypothetical protein [Candidatus Heimdallarchaeota archaeon]MCK4609982.1 hypothetical protein [Candidatus Heimdallarchaeota archaeon]
MVIFSMFYLVWYLTIRFINWGDTPSKSDYRILIILLVVISFVSPLISFFAWHWVGKWVVKKLVINTIKIKHKKEHEIKEVFGKLKSDREYKKYKFFRFFFTMMFNIDIEPATQYYLEEEAIELNVGSIKEFLQKRMYELITSTLGIGFLAAVIINFTKPSSIFWGFVAGFFIILCSTIFVAWITPVIWTIRDARIAFIKSNNESHTLADRMRRSVVSRLFNVSAFLAGISFLMNVFDDIGVVRAGDPITYSILLFLTALAALMLIIVLISGTTFLVGIIYLSTFHEKNVNKLRDELSKIIKFAQTNAVLSEYYST